jgi:putative glycosyltransferase (TIGR04348 family)
MRISISTPLRPHISSGNAVTAERWSRRLGEMGHEVEVSTYSSPDDPALLAAQPAADVAIVLHATRGAHLVASLIEELPDRPVIVVLTGTDLYRDLPEDPLARATIDTATRIAVLQPAARNRVAAIDRGLAAKTYVVHQSVDDPPSRVEASDDFIVAVLAHLRDVKDPLLAARAARRLPADSRIRIVHAGGASLDSWAGSARAEQAGNDRYEWRGEVDRAAAMRLLAESSALAVTSVSEGGANVVTEALAVGLPVVGTDIDGNRGLLGDDYPGLVPVGDADALADVLRRLEIDAAFRTGLQTRIDERRELASPAHERRELSELLASLS